MRKSGRVALALLVFGLAACGSSHPAVTPTPPSVTAPISATTVQGFVVDTALRAVSGAMVEVLNGPQAGASTTSDDKGRFSLTGLFDAATQFRATKEDHLAAVSAFSGVTLTFTMQMLVAPVNIVGDYTLMFIADSACTDLPNDVRTRTYAATITADLSPSVAPNTRLRVALSGADLDTYYNFLTFLVAGDYVSYDLSDNYIEEELAPETYVAIGGAGGASMGTTGGRTITAPFNGTFDYCVTKTEMGSRYSCSADQAVVHARCTSANHRLVLTRR